MRWCVPFLVFLPGAAWAQAPAVAPQAPAPASTAPASTAPAPRSAFTGAPAVVGPTPLPVPPRAAAPAPVAPPKRAAPEARTGFQMHFVPLTALLFPFGEATAGKGDALSGRYSWQWMPLEIGLGAKVIDQLYFGGYLNVGVGLEGSDNRTEGRCESGNDFIDDVSCSSTSVRLGLEVRYTFTPEESLSGWIGYGFGWTNGSQTISDAGHYSETSTVQGLELARLSGGLDFRASRGFGLGPFAMVSLGRYTHQRTELNNVVTFSGSIDEPALHAWASVGLRMVIFP
jgi:hypothetical protein